MREVAIIIPIRKGSARFPGKNTFGLRGKPLYRWTLDHALQLNCPVYFSHDYEPGQIELPQNQNIIEVRQKDIPQNNNLSQEIRRMRIDAEVFVLLQVTTPLRNMRMIQNYLKDFKNDRRLKCGIGAYKLKDGFYYSNDAYPYNFTIDHRRYGDCFKKPVFVETGSFYFFRKCQLQKQHITDTLYKKIYEDSYNIDIDQIEDIFSFQKKYWREVNNEN